MDCISTVSFIPKRNRSKMVFEFTLGGLLLFVGIILYFVLILADKRN